MRVLVAAQTEAEARKVIAGLTVYRDAECEVIGTAVDRKTKRSKPRMEDHPNLRPWVTLRLDEYDAVAALDLDRLVRPDDEGISSLKTWADDNDKSVLFTNAGIRYPMIEPNDWIMWELYERIMRDKWSEHKRHIDAMLAAKHTDGGFFGRAPWGYEHTIVNGVRTIVPTAVGREWVPRIFQWVVDEMTGEEIAAELNRAGIRSGAADGKWVASRIYPMIKRTTYSGSRPRGGHADVSVPALVPPELQARAIATLARNAAPRPTESRPKALLAELLCGHPACPGCGSWRMYRIVSGNHDYYYDRRCGAPTIRTDILDELVLSFGSYWELRPHTTQRLIAGNDQAVKVEELRSEMTEALRSADPAKMLSITAGYAGKIAELEEFAELDRWEAVPTGQTEGEYLLSLDLDGKREFLARQDIKAWREGPTVSVTVNGALVTTGGPSALSSG